MEKDGLKDKLDEAKKAEVEAINELHRKLCEIYGVTKLGVMVTLLFPSSEGIHIFVNATFETPTLDQVLEAMTSGGPSILVNSDILH